MAPSDNLVRTIMAMESGLPLPDDVNRWLLNGLRKHRDGVPLEVSLGLKVRPGGAYDRLEVSSRLRSRDTAIRAFQYWLYQDISTWEAADKISSMINAHRSGKPIQKPLGYFSSLTSLLDKLVQPEMDTPKSQRQIHRILKGDRSC